MQTAAPARRRATRATLWLAAAGLAVVFRWPWMAAGVVEDVVLGAPLAPAPGGEQRRASPHWRAAADACLVEPGERIARASGLDGALVAAIRAAIPDDGTAVLFLPHAGPVWQQLLRQQWERTKNLLYPRPRDVRFAQSDAELEAITRLAQPGRLVVIDGSLRATPPADAAYEPVEIGASAAAPRLVRLWRLKGRR